MIYAVLAAAVYTVACPPYEWALAAWLAPGLLLVGTRALRPWPAFGAGVLFGGLIGFGVAGWMRDAASGYFGLAPGAATTFVVAVWLFALGVPYGLLVRVHAGLAGRVPAGVRPFLAAWLWVAVDLARAHVTGMPWQLLGHSQYRVLTIIQVADLGGVYLVSFLVALASVAAVDVARLLGRSRRARGVLALTAPAAACVGAALVYGVQARAPYVVPADRGDVRTMAVVPGSLPALRGWSREHAEAAITAYERATAALRGVRPDVIVWPENAANFYLAREPRLLGRLARVAAVAREGLVVGGPRRAADGTARSAVYLIGRRGRIVAFADKQRLVPFAESAPLGWSLTPPGPRFTPGFARGPLVAGPLRLGATVCIEVIFPDVVRRLVQAGADVLVNVANDGWLGPPDGAAARQHFSIAVFRAVETRRPLVRAAAGGISGVVGPDGAPSVLLPVTADGARAAAVVPGRGLTAYVRFGDVWIGVVGLPLAVALWHGRRRAGTAVEPMATPA